MKISRRAVLRGLGAAVSLPLLDVTAPDHASAAAKPVNRLAYLFFPNGFPRGAWEPAKIINRVPGLGTLQVGAPADISIFDLVDGPVEFVDTRNNRRTGTKKLVPWLTVKGGRPWGRPPLPIPVGEDNESL